MTFDINKINNKDIAQNFIFNNISSAILILDSDLKILSINNSVLDIFHIQHDEAIGAILGNALHCILCIEQNDTCGLTNECINCNVRKELVRIIREKSSFSDINVNRSFYLNNEKVDKYFNVSAKYINYDSNDACLLILEDRTELSKQRHDLLLRNKQLEEINLQKNKILGIAAHDMRNPLAAVISAAELLLDYDSANISDDGKQMIEIIHNSSDFMVALLNDIVDVSKIEAGEMNITKSSFNYNQFIDKVVGLNGFAAAKKNISLVFDYLENVNYPMVELDHDKMRQVIDNLINNAIKYSHEGTTITITVEFGTDFVKTKVIDQGQGIPHDDLDSLFEYFKTANVRSTANEKSTGLGLAIVKKIIENHNGNIGVTSTVNVGSEFYFTLPLT